MLFKDYQYDAEKYYGVKLERDDQYDYDYRAKPDPEEDNENNTMESIETEEEESAKESDYARQRKYRERDYYRYYTPPSLTRSSGSGSTPDTPW